MFTPIHCLLWQTRIIEVIDKQLKAGKIDPPALYASTIHEKKKFTVCGPIPSFSDHNDPKWMLVIIFLHTLFFSAKVQQD